MRYAICSAVALLVWAVLLAGTAPAQQPAADAEQTRKVEELILQLDSDNFQTREDAEKALAGLGDKAIDAVTKATRSTSAEVRQRAARILRDLRKGAVGLKHLTTLKREDMQGVCGLEMSPDGKFVYAAAWQSNSINVFRRDEATGQLEHVQALVDPANLQGVVCIRINPTGKLALAVSFGSKTVTLLSRDPEKGTLAVAHAAGPELGPGMSLTWPIQGDFSPDSKFIYAVDDRAGAVAVFEVTGEGRLKWVQFSEGKDGCFQGARSLAMHPDGKTVLVGGMRSGTLAVLDRDGATGRIEVRQVLVDGQSDGTKQIGGLAGIHGVDISPDGKHAYTTAGRFAGDQAIGAYQFGDDGKLKLLKEFVADESDLVNFQGGNKGYISADGRSFYACGTVSQSLACFTRKPATGELSFVATIHNDSTGAGSELGPANLQCSPDGRFAYLTLETNAAISIFERAAPK